MKLSKKIKKPAIKLKMKSTSKREALEELVDLLCSAYKLKNREEILEAIIRREEKQSTGIGMGLAVPHAKTPAVKELYVASGLSVEGIDFDSVDGDPARIFFILVSPKDISGPHIKALAGISRLVKHEEFRRDLLECSEVKEYLDVVKEAESKYL